MVAGLIVKPWLSVGEEPGMIGSSWLNAVTSSPSIRISPVQLTSWNGGSAPRVVFGAVDGVNVQLVGARVTWPVIGFSPMSVNTSAATRVPEVSLVAWRTAWEPRRPGPLTGAPGGAVLSHVARNC